MNHTLRSLNCGSPEWCLVRHLARSSTLDHHIRKFELVDQPCFVWDYARYSDFPNGILMRWTPVVNKFRNKLGCKSNTLIYYKTTKYKTQVSQTEYKECASPKGESSIQ